MPAISVSPAEALIDAPLTLSLSGFSPREVVKVGAKASTAQGRSLSSHAVFVADADGAIDLSSSAPVAGDYRIADSGGLVWSLTVDLLSSSAPSFTRYIDTGLAPYAIEFTAYDEEGNPQATATAIRQPIAPEVTRVPVRENGLYGTLFLPPGEGAAPAIIVVPGSTGGTPENLAALYASHGYVVFALAYFRAEHPGYVPDELSEIPLEYFRKAIDWLRATPRVRDGRIALDGVSRGGELVLLLGTLFRDIDAIVAWVPSSHVVSAFGRGPEGRTKAAWTWGGEDIPFITLGTGIASRQNIELDHGVPTSHLEQLRWIARHPEQASAAAIPVEKITAPVMLLSGRSDVMWPSATFSDWIVERLERHSFGYEYEHLSYENAGHSLGPPLNPATQIISQEQGSFAPYSIGGTVEGIAKARADLWPRVLDFLARTLGDPLSSSPATDRQ